MITIPQPCIRTRSPTDRSRRSWREWAAPLRITSRSPGTGTARPFQCSRGHDTGRTGTKPNYLLASMAISICKDRLRQARGKRGWGDPDLQLATVVATKHSFASTRRKSQLGNNRLMVGQRRGGLDDRCHWNRHLRGGAVEDMIDYPDI